MAEFERHSEELSKEKLVHVLEDYEAGYEARNREQPMSVGATASWQAGWTDASRELGSFADLFAPGQTTLPFSGTGKEARRRGLTFEPSRSEVWKRDWIETDILLGAAETISTEA